MLVISDVSQVLDFYPRPPRGGRRRARSCACRCDTISIHALLAEGDLVPQNQPCPVPYFYPRPPRGGRLDSPCAHCQAELFLSTPSSRRATRGLSLSASSGKFLSTPSSRRATGDRVLDTHLGSDFYPRPPRGGRQQKQRENTLLLSHYTPLCTNCKERSANQTAKSHRYLRKRLVFRCEASRKTMCAADSHWPDIKRAARCLGQILGAVQRARPSSGSCCQAGRTADCPRQGRSGRSALL